MFERRGEWRPYEGHEGIEECVDAPVYDTLQSNMCFPSEQPPHTDSLNPLTYNTYHLYKQEKEVIEFG